MQVYEYEGGSPRIVNQYIGCELARFLVLYTRVSARKHKKWEGDGILICYAEQAILKSENEKDIISRATAIKCVDELKTGKELRIGSWEVQILEKLEMRNFHAHSSSSLVSNQEISSACSDASSAKEHRLPASIVPEIDLTLEATGTRDFVHNSIRNRFKCPLAKNSDSAVEEQTFIINEDNIKELGEQPVIADPFISRHLKVHQKEGIRFIYSAMQKGHGVILADEMGLGKSVQTIVATMALMKQTHTKQASKKCLLVVPSSLINNWKCEFRKWFQNNRLPIVTVKQPADINTYLCSSVTYPYLIIGYEMALRCSGKLASVKFDIIVCDEGHRLKNMNTKLRKFLDSLAVSRRLLITGTPIQNDIEEFFSLLNFVHPTKFSNIADFRKGCISEAGTKNAAFVDCFIRRTSEIMDAYLPDKHEYIFFCAPSSIQRTVLCAICDQITSEPFVSIDMMRKTSNHPALLFEKLLSAGNEKISHEYTPLIATFPEGYGNRPLNLADSGKLSVLVEMMACFFQNRECVVIVSNFTKTLDMLSSLCLSLGLRVLRLDGQTPLSTRQQIVEQFNSSGEPENVLLLSTKAGGLGLNLTGASRLILFDLNWNPATDMQAMARIWRHEQQKTCHIYRLITSESVHGQMPYQKCNYHLGHDRRKNSPTAVTKNWSQLLDQSE